MTINNYHAYSVKTNEIIVFLHNFMNGNIETLSSHTECQCDLYAA